jgi:hypothetical protein
MTSKYPYLDPDWIPLLKAWTQPPSYDPNQSSEMIARQLAHYNGKIDLISRLETIINLQEKKKNAE